MGCGKIANMKRSLYEAAFKAKVTQDKAKVAPKATNAEMTMAQITSKFGGHPHQVRRWRDQLVSTLPELFPERGKKQKTDLDKEEIQHV
jgi:transposase-like protein